MVTNQDKAQPFSQWEEVEVDFLIANTDTVVPHTLLPPTPEHVNYIQVRGTGPGHVFHDATFSRKPWQATYIILQCSNVKKVRLLLYVPHDKPTYSF